MRGAGARARVVLLVGLALGCGCSDGGRQDKPDASIRDAATVDVADLTPPATEAAFCQRKATVECASVAARCNVPVASCQTARVAACTNLAAQQRSVVRMYKPANTDACFDAIESAFQTVSVRPRAGARCGTPATVCGRATAVP